MKLIETKTLGTAAATIQFTSIPQTFTDLLVTFSLRTDRAALTDTPQLRVNGATTGYTQRKLEGNGSSASSGTETGQTYLLLDTINGATTTANTFSNSSLYIPNYTGSTNKTMSSDGVYENNASTSFQRLEANLWSNTSAITSLSLLLFSGRSYVAGSTISLYGILKGSDGITTAS
jgi:hypothetical protein